MLGCESDTANRSDRPNKTVMALLHDLLFLMNRQVLLLFAEPISFRSSSNKKFNEIIVQPATKTVNGDGRYL